MMRLTGTPKPESLKYLRVAKKIEIPLIIRSAAQRVVNMNLNIL